MPKDTDEEFPHQSLRCYWPEKFTKHRHFDRLGENQPYIEYLSAPRFYSEEEEEEDDNIDDLSEDEDEVDWQRGESENKDEKWNDNKNAEACNRYSNARLFMTGMIGDENNLQYRDQVEQVASFCEQASLREFEKKAGQHKKRVALLDDRNDRGSILMKKGNCRPYLGPLTSEQLVEELSKKRFTGGLDQEAPTNEFEIQCDAERRLIFITDLDACTIEALIRTASRTQAAALRDLVYKYLTSKSSIGVTIPSRGFEYFTLDFHIPFYVLRESQKSRKDTRKKSNGEPLRQSWELPFLSMPMNKSTPSDEFYRLYEAQISVAVTGIDHWVWTAYGFVDVYFDSNETVDGYDQIRGQYCRLWGRVDPFAAGQIIADEPIWMPREYFLKVFEIRMNQVLREWNWIVDKVEKVVEQSRANHIFPLSSNDPKIRKQVRDFSVWNVEMVRLLRQLISGLSSTVEAWDQFQQKEIGYFRCQSEPQTALPSLKSSVAAVEKAFWKLKVLLRILENLKNELCEDNPQGVNAHLSIENNEAAIFQQRAARQIEVLIIIFIAFFPLGLSSALFSTNGVLPFAPNLIHFTYVLLILAVLMVATLLVLFNWHSWLRQIVGYAPKTITCDDHRPGAGENRDAVSTSPISLKQVFFRGKLRKTGLHKGWDLEQGHERADIGSTKFEDTPKTPTVPSKPLYISPSGSRYSLDEMESTSESHSQPSAIRAFTIFASGRRDEAFIDTSDEPFLKLSDKPSLYAEKIREGFKRLGLSRGQSISASVWVSYQVSWDVPTYLNELFNPQQKLSEVLTLTAGLSDEFCDGFATSVGDYMEKTWKSTGIFLLQTIEIWLSNKRKGETVQRNSDIEIRIKNRAGIGIPQYDKAEKTTNIKIDINARGEDHVDLATALSWLCASLRFSPHAALSSSGVNISKIPSSNDKRIEIAIRPTDLVLCSEARGCWNILFTKSVIAKGFQIPTREEGKGLEISFPTMRKLAEILRWVEYDQGLVGEGLNTLLVPIKLLDKDQAMQWHIEEKLVLSQVGAEYQDRSVTNILSSYRGWHRELLPEALARKRAFLGWAYGAKVTTGTIDRPTEVRDSGGSVARPDGPCITSYNLTVRSRGLDFRGPGFGVAAAPARGQTYFTRNHSTILKSKLQDAAESEVILYDADANFTWRVPQSSFMVCMIHAAILQRDLKVDSSQGSMKYADCKESHKLGLDDVHAALRAIRASWHLKLWFENLCLNIELVTGFLAKQRSNPERGSEKPPEWILGIELNDVFQEKNKWSFKTSKIRQPGPHPADNTCPIFFCQNLGQAIAPTDLGRLCKAFQRVARKDISKRSSLILPLRRAFTNFAIRFRKKQKGDSLHAVELDLDYQGQDDQTSRQVNSSQYGLYVPSPHEPTRLVRPYAREQQLEKDGHFAVDLDRQPRNNPRSRSVDAAGSGVIIARQRSTNSIKRKQLPSGNKENLHQELDRCCFRHPAAAELSTADEINEWDDSDETSNCTRSGHVHSRFKMYYPPSSMRTTADEVAMRADGEKKSLIQAPATPATPATELGPEHILKEQGGQSIVFPTGDPIEQRAMVDSGEDDIKGTLNTAGSGSQSSALYAIEPVSDEVDSEIDRTIAVAENDMQEPASSKIESGAGYIEEDEADFMKLLSNVPVVIQDSEGESQAVNAVIDTGASSSFISREVAHQYGLQEMPLHLGDIKSFVAIDCEGVTPTTFVVLHLKCSKIGLNEFVRAHIRVLDVNKFDIIFGRPFLQQHRVLNNLFTMPQSKNRANLLFIIQQKHSDNGDSLVNDEDTHADSTTAFESSPSISYPSLPGIEETMATGAPSALLSDFSETESLSTEEDSDSDEERVTQNSGQGSFVDMVPKAFDIAYNGENLASLLRPMGQAVVDKLMAEFWELFDQNWAGNTRKCPESSEFTTASQYTSENKSSAQNSTDGKDKKRCWANGDDENSKEENGGPPKRPRRKLCTKEILGPDNNFACPYRKYNPQIYCHHSRKWWKCALRSFPDVSRLKAHLYACHKIYQCDRCRETFSNEEGRKEHRNAAVKCERPHLDEAEGVRGVNAEIERLLRNRKKTDPTQSQRDRWEKIYAMLFGEQKMPTPYFEPLVEGVNTAGAVSSPDSRQLADFEEYHREEFPRVFKSHLQRAARAGVRTIEDRLRRSLHDVFRDIQDEIFSSYRSIRTSTEEVSSVDPLQAEPMMPLIGSQSALSRGLPNFNMETLGSFFSQPPHQIGFTQGIELSTANTTAKTSEDIPFSDSGYHADSIVNAPNPIASRDATCAGRANEDVGVQHQVSTNLNTTGLPLMLDGKLEGENDSFLVVSGQEYRASEVLMDEASSPTREEINERIMSSDTIAWFDSVFFD